MTKIQLAPNVTPKAKYSENFKRVIEKKLIEIASEDKLFERSFLKENKNIVCMQQNIMNGKTLFCCLPK